MKLTKIESALAPVVSEMNRISAEHPGNLMAFMIGRGQYKGNRPIGAGPIQWGEVGPVNRVDSLSVIEITGRHKVQAGFQRGSGDGLDEGLVLCDGTLTFTIDRLMEVLCRIGVDAGLVA